MHRSVVDQIGIGIYIYGTESTAEEYLSTSLYRFAEMPIHLSGVWGKKFILV